MNPGCLKKAACFYFRLIKNKQDLYPVCAANFFELMSNMAQS